MISNTDDFYSVPDNFRTMPRLPKGCTHFFYAIDADGIYNGLESVLEATDGIVKIKRSYQTRGLSINKSFYDGLSLVKISESDYNAVLDLMFERRQVQTSESKSKVDILISNLIKPHVRIS